MEFFRWHRCHRIEQEGCLLGSRCTFEKSSYYKFISGCSKPEKGILCRYHKAGS